MTTTPTTSMSQEGYFRQAVQSPVHKALATALSVLAVLVLLRHLWSLLLLLAAVEALYLLFVPNLPSFRQACDQRRADEMARRKAKILEDIAGRLSPAAKARYEGLGQLKGRILDAIRTQPGAEALESLWAPRLSMMQEWALRFLVAVDASRLTTRDGDSLKSEIDTLQARLDAMGEDDPARSPVLQRLQLANERVERSRLAVQRRESAVAQFEAIEGVFEDLLTQGLPGRDEDAFAGRLEVIGAQVQALGDTLSTMTRDECASYGKVEPMDRVR